MERVLPVFILLFFNAARLPAQAPSPTPFSGVWVTVHDTVVGTSPSYLGGNEGGAFRTSDLVDCGVNLYRIWATMGELEYYDDDWVAAGYPGWPTYDSVYYGVPTIAGVKADVNLVPWAIWDDAFTRARWTTAAPFKDVLDGCVAAGAEPLLVLRTKGPGEGWIDWVPNAPDGADFWEEWWEYCFAVAYWCNVRNSYNVTRFQIHNEPDLAGQGWQGTQAQYVQLIEYARDALVFANTLAGLPVYLHAPMVSNYSSSYISYSLDNADSSIDVVDYHVYDKYHSLPTSIQTVKQTIIDHNTDGIEEPVWISEWGDLDLNYNTQTRGLLTARQLYQMAAGGVEGSAIFMFYDWGSDESGLIDETTFTPYDSYYAFRLMLRGLQGGRDILQADLSEPSERIMVTREGDTVCVLAVEVGDEVGVDISSLAGGTGPSDLYTYNAAFKDQTSGVPVVSDGTFSFTAPTEAALCLVISLSGLVPSPTPSATPTPSVTPTPSPSPSVTPTPTTTPSPSPTPTATVTPSPSATSSPTPTPSLTPMATATPTATPSVAPSPTRTPSPSPTPSVTPSTTPTPSPSLTATPSVTPTPSMTPTPTPSPTPMATATPSPSPTPTPLATPTPSPLPTPHSPLSIIASGDYNGDGTSEIAVFRPSSGLWAVRGLGRVYFGAPGDLPVGGDYDGDGYTDVAVFRPSTGLWAIKEISRAYHGGSGDLPVPADYDGDGLTDLAVFRESSGLWRISNITLVYFGGGGDRPVPGDYSSDGTSEIAVFRPSTGLWALRGLTRVYFGRTDDLPVPASYRGGEESEIGIFRPSTGLWAVRELTRTYWGVSGDWPRPADYDGDSTDEPGVFRPASGLWTVRSLTRVYFGASGDIPVTR